MFIAIKLPILIAGLLLPGYMLARLLRLEQPWIIAFPFSALVLVETVIGFSFVGIPIRFSTMASALALFLTICLFLHKFRKSSPPPVSPVDLSRISSHLAMMALSVTTVIITLVAFRTTLFPLAGFDTIFRWEGLAREMLLQQSLDFYPPVNGSDYISHLYADGIPPLVATVYWWIYAVMGGPLPEMTSISIVLQLAATMALTYYGTRQAYGTRAAWFALLLVSTAPLLIKAFAIGQETGFTTLAVAGQICFAWAAVRSPKRSLVVTAALFAVIGALARDYGPALAISGFAVLAWHPHTRRFLVTYTLVVVICSAPWYLRTWALTGNPFFPHLIPGGFNTNPVHVALHEYYKEIFSLSHLSATDWVALLKLLFSGAAVAIFIGLTYGLLHSKETFPLLISAGTVILLWIYSVAQTSGGVEYSTRVLAPAVIPLSIIAAAAVDCFLGTLLWGKKHVKVAFVFILSVCTLYGSLSAASHPLPYIDLSAFTVTNSGPPKFCIAQQKLADELQKSNLMACGVLTDDLYLGIILKRETRFTPIMVWNPDVRYVFDRDLLPREIQRRLREANILLVTMNKENEDLNFLMRFPFFQKYTEWSLLTPASDPEAIFMIPKN